MTDINQALIYTLFAILPGFIWMLFFLNKDDNPEPKRVILKVFIAGMTVTLPVFFIELGLLNLLDNFSLESDVYDFIQYFLIVGVAEELFKYIAFKFTALKSQYLMNQ